MFSKDRQIFIYLAFCLGEKKGGGGGEYAGYHEHEADRQTDIRIFYLVRSPKSILPQVVNTLKPPPQNILFPPETVRTICHPR